MLKFQLQKVKVERHAAKTNYFASQSARKAHLLFIKKRKSAPTFVNAIL